MLGQQPLRPHTQAAQELVGGGPSSGPSRAQGDKSDSKSRHAYWSKLKDLIWGTEADNAKKQAVVGTHLVIKAAFPSPTAAEMAEISQIQYKMEYTESVSEWGSGKIKGSTTKCWPVTRIPRQSFKC